MFRKTRQTKTFTGLTLALLACILIGCGRNETNRTNNSGAIADGRAEVTPMATEAKPPAPCELILAPHAGTNRVDLEIQRQQANVRNELNTIQSLEKLGWLFVAKARESFDPGYFKLAEQCAFCLESRQ